MQKSTLQDLIKKAEVEAAKSGLSDQIKYILDQKIETLKSLN